MIVAVLVTVVLAISLGYFLAKTLAKKSPLALESASLQENIENVLSVAQKQREMILQEAQHATKQQYLEEAEKLELERQTALRLQEDFEQELNKKQSDIDKKENELQHAEEQMSFRSLELNVKQQNVNTSFEQHKNIQHEFESHLEIKAAVNRSELFKEMREELVNAEKLGISRWLMENNEALKTEATKFSRDSLNAIYMRYQPSFIWPKNSFIVQAHSKDVLEKHFHTESNIRALLLENTMTSLDIMDINHEQQSHYLKISGGAGVDKEVIRLTLEEILAKDNFNPDKVRNIIEKHRKHIDNYTLKLGAEAVKILGLPADVHPEILKLIGSLNYRTSHRQNQYFHSIEVARLAGMIADEVGVDSTLAKRSGLLHDIGKALDYKIEGSHAVISGDYATRFGESEQVIDTVLAHHDDKIVETAHAYILKAADAMSGARPGARVDMEEGYHRRIDGISNVVDSFKEQGVLRSAIMHAGREVHVFVDNTIVKYQDMDSLAEQIAHKLETEVEFPGQIRVTVVRRLEVTEVA